MTCSGCESLIGVMLMGMVSLLVYAVVRVVIAVVLAFPSLLSLPISGGKVAQPVMVQKALLVLLLVMVLTVRLTPETTAVLTLVHPRCIRTLRVCALLVKVISFAALVTCLKLMLQTYDILRLLVLPLPRKKV